MGIERTDENVLMMVDKLIDMIIATKSSDVVFDAKGNLHPRTKIHRIEESDIKRIIKKVNKS